MRLAWAAGGAGLVILLFWAWPVNTEPTYKARPLHEWVEFLAGPSTEARAAVQTLGTNCVPHLLRWIAYQGKTNASDRPFVWALSATPSAKNWKPVQRWLARRQQRALRAQGSAVAFAVLGNRASDAVPALARLANTAPRPVAERAVDALIWMGPRAVPPLLGTVTNQASRVRLYAIGLMLTFGVGTTAAVPVFTGLLSDPATDVAAAAARALGRMQLQPQLVVPGLTNALRDHRLAVRAAAARALEDLEQAALPAVPSLLAALEDKAREVREAATNAIVVIAPGALTNLLPFAAE